MCAEASVEFREHLARVFFHHVGSGDHNQVIGLANKWLYLLCYLASPYTEFFLKSCYVIIPITPLLRRLRQED